MLVRREPPVIVRREPAIIVEGRSHAALLAALHGEAFAAVERWDAAAMAALLDMPGCFACLAPGCGAPDGMALLRVAADEAELLSIAVLPGSRKRGVGSALIEAGLAACGSRGATRIFLEVATGNLAAHALYRGRGFTEAGRRRGYYPDGSDALLMSRALEHVPFA